MKRFKVSLYIALLVALCLPAVGQSKLLVVDVPFNFVAAGRSLPAGEYRVSRAFLWSDDGWSIRSSKHSAAIITNEVRSPNKAHKPSMVFIHTSDGYSLAQIWTSERTGHELQLSPSVKTIILTEEEKTITSPQYVEIPSK
jgi:hypothetical protein